ncbi:MAG: hypothetical protein WD181_00865 [Solirubrobacterales bacterium]
MNHRRAVIDFRRILPAAIALFLAFVISAGVIAVVAPGADARVQAPKVSLKITTSNQAALLRTDRLFVTVRSSGKATVSVSGSAAGGGSLFRSVKVSFGDRGGARSVSLPLTSQGQAKLSLCGAKSVKAEGRFAGGTAQTSKTLARDASRCITVPLGTNPTKCDFLDTSVCLQPFANDYFTKPADTPTGKQLNFDPSSTPANKSTPSRPNGVNIDPTDMNRGDGFSPGNLIVLKIPGLDTPAAFENSNLVPITDLNAYDSPSQSVMVINADTGERHPIWAELDSNPTTVDPSNDGPGGINTDPGNTEDVNLIVRPAENFDHDQRYIVIFRNLKNAQNRTIPSPPAFRTYRDRIVTSQPVVEQRRSHMYSLINTAVNKAGVARSSMYMAWDFTVASAESVTSRALTIRDDAFERLGDNNLADRVISGDSPGYTITSATDPGGTTLIRVEGRLEDVPCYISSANCAPGGTFQFNDDDELIWNENSTTDVPFRCNVPESVLTNNPGSVTPTQTGTYGHGLLGSYSQVNGQDRVGKDGNTTWCAVDWAGFSDLDLSSVGASLADMSNFPKMVDRMQQGFVNFLYLQRLLIHPDGISQAPQLQVDPDAGGPEESESAIDTSEGEDTRGQYMGISQGGIMGSALTALSPDVDYGVLGVPGINYSTLLRRSVDSDEYFKAAPIGLYLYYPKQEERMLLLSMIQLLWDRGEGNGYAHFATDTPLPNTPPHEILMRVAFSDHQVANVTAEVAARTWGSKVYFPALEPGRHWEDDPFMGIERVTDFPFQDGSIMVYYDSGPIGFEGKSRQGVNPPPTGNVPPRPEWDFGSDPHGQPRASASGIRHAVTFLNGPSLALGNTRGVIESCALTGVGDYFSGTPATNPRVTTPISPPEPGNERCFSNGWNGSAGTSLP